MSTITTDHNTIRKWAEDRGARPARVKGTGSEIDAGLLRIELPGWNGDRSLEPITWDEFFEKFERSRLALAYQETSVDGERSDYNKLVKRDASAPKVSNRGSRRPVRKASRTTGTRRKPARSRRPVAKRKPTRRRATQGR